MRPGMPDLVFIEPIVLAISQREVFFPAQAPLIEVFRPDLSSEPSANFVPAG
jgi:hypothetical protein